MDDFIRPPKKEIKKETKQRPIKEILIVILIIVCLAIGYFAGYVSIFLGAISWWFTITYLINKVRTRFNLRSIWLINRSIGIIIIIMAIVGFVMGINSYFSLNLF